MEFFGQNLEKKVQNRKSEHHHRISHTRSSLATKFQVKLVILSFWTKFAQKQYSQSKIDKMNTI